jgi:hypothetical protein
VIHGTLQSFAALANAKSGTIKNKEESISEVKEWDGI